MQISRQENVLLNAQTLLTDLLIILTEVAWITVLLKYLQQLILLTYLKIIQQSNTLISTEIRDSVKEKYSYLVYI